MATPKITAHQIITDSSSTWQLVIDDEPANITTLDQNAYGDVLKAIEAKDPIAIQNEIAKLTNTEG